MSKNNIVDELRAYLLPDMLFEHSELFEKAADQIEQIKAIASDLYHHLDQYICMCRLSKCKCGYDDVMDAYREVFGE